MISACFLLKLDKTNNLHPTPYHYPERKYDAGGRKYYVVVRRRHFVAHLCAPSAHLFHVGILGSHLGVWRNVAPVQKNVSPVCRQHIDVWDDGVGIRQSDQHGQQLRFGIGKNEYPGQGDKQEGQLHGLGGQMHCNPIRKNGILAPHLVQAVRRQHAGVRENSDGIFHRVFVHVHVDARMGHIDVVPEHS